MKILRFFPLVIGLLTLGLTSCNEDIEYDGDFKETAIVFGLLDQADSVHFIKITRAFGGGNNSLEVAQIADSSYFQNIDVVVDEVISGAVTRSWTLQDSILTDKEPGVFYNPDQKVYYFKTTAANPLVANAKYKLRATVNNGEFIVYGETSLVKDLAIVSPNQNAAISFATSNVSQNGYNTAALNINGGTSEVLDLRLKIFFDEYRAGVPTEKSFTWKLGELNGSQINTGNTPFYANGQIFYELIRDNCTKNDPTIDDRQLSRIQIIATGGSDDLNKYILLNKPSSGLAQNKPTFTNITTSDGRRAIGLFSARSTVTQEKPEWVNALPYYRAIDNNSTKELCTGPITGNYLFCSDHPSDIAASLSYICN
jgi:hypothetical protein